MKYETITDFIIAAKAGKFTGRVIVDNDQVTAYEGDEIVCDFEDCGPDGALIEVMAALGVKAERP
jgi:hypothetical protein